MKNILTLALWAFTAFISYAGVFDGKTIVKTNESRFLRMAEMANHDYLLVYFESYGSSATAVTRVNAQGQTLWSKALGGTENWFLMDCGAYADGSAYLLFSGQNGYTEYMVVKLDAQGHVAWSDRFAMAGQFNGQYNTHVTAKTTSNGGLAFVADSWSYTGAIIIDSAGALVNSFFATIDVNTCGDCSKNPGFDIAPGNNGSFILTGKRDATPVVICVNPNGTKDWVLSYYHNDYYSRPYSITSTADGNYLVGGLTMHYAGNVMGPIGMSLVKITPQGGVLWSKLYTGVGLAIDSIFGGGVYLRQIMENPDGTFTGVGINYQMGGNLAVYAKFTSTGDFMNAWHYNATGYYPGGEPMLFKSPGGNVKVLSYDQTGNNETQASILVPDNISSYCNSLPLQLANENVSLIPDNTVSSVTSVATATLSHPDIIPTDFTDNFTVEDICLTTGIASVSAAKNDFAIMPNPAANTTTITTGAEFTGGDLVVTDLTGRQAAAFTLMAQATSINTTGLPDGVYVVTVRKGELAAVKKLVVQR